MFFTGLSGSGKSTVARALLVKLLELGGRPITLLDGDIVRKNLSSELGFSKEHRDLNIRRIGFVANEITKNGGIAICAPIAPYDSIRKQNEALISANGGYILVHISTPIEVCEQRDRKGLYAKARAGCSRECFPLSDLFLVGRSLGQITRYGALGNMISEHERFPVNARCSSGRVFRSHLDNQSTDLTIQSRASWLAALPR